MTLDVSSVLWRYLGDARFGLVLGRAFLLQLMHPTIAAGVDEHSDFRADPWGRLSRSYGAVLRVVYAPDGERVGAEVRAAHRGITGIDRNGRRYHAWEPEAYWWVLATGLDSAFALADRFGPPMDRAARFAAYDETRELGRRFGLRERDMQETFAAFETWYAAIVAERLEDSRVVRDLLDLIARPPSPPSLPALAWRPVRPFASRALWLATLGTLPPAARERLDVGWSSADRAQLAALTWTVRALGCLPARWRYLSAARDGFARQPPPAGRAALTHAGMSEPPGRDDGRLRCPAGRVS